MKRFFLTVILAMSATVQAEECGTGGCYTDAIQLNDKLSVRFFRYGDSGGFFNTMMGNGGYYKTVVQFWTSQCALKPFDFQVQYSGDGYDDNGNHHEGMQVTEKHTLEHGLEPRYWKDAIEGYDHGSLLARDNRNPVVTILSPLECVQENKK